MSKRKPRIHRCSKCNRTAVWMYMPGRYGHYMYCDEHVPRGCSCNNYDLEYDGEPEKYRPVAWWSRDNQNLEKIDTVRKKNSYHYQYLYDGKLLPCCEYDHEPEGIEFLDMVTITPVSDVKKAITMALNRVDNYNKNKSDFYRQSVLEILSKCERRSRYVNHNQFMQALKDFSILHKFNGFGLLTESVKNILSAYRTTMWAEDWYSKKLQTP